VDTAGKVRGVLSLHYRKPGPPRGRPELVASAASHLLAPMLEAAPWQPQL
jgi:hypothetical protein